MKKLVVTGVDGNFGSVVATEIQKLVPKEQLIFTAPRIEKLKQYADAGIECRDADFNSQANLEAAFRGAEKVLLISMPFVGEKRRKAQKNAVEACVAAGVSQVLYTSVLSAGNPLNPSIENVDHGYTEALIQNSGLDYVILRNSLFAESFITDYTRAVASGEQAIEKNMGEGRVWFISRKDAALAATCALASNLLHRAVLNINGCEPLTYGDFLAVGNQVTGNDIHYVKKTDEELYEYFDSIGVPRNTDGDFSKSPIKATSEGMVTFGTTVREGYLDMATSDFSSVCGRLPISVKEMFADADNYQLGDRHPTE
ncbi:NAD(P)H-binding protein [Lactobacillus sp. ESL0681]|uniref:NAD(P)H-binding protein n=1 Tax=Lactobacillus sp. ESL0681 TaxID=2983211 RepID=UPI0023FA040E|nr:NAD(P)H-binding protein [Lactobacillus sp. ESL0681]WEV40925.1 NAD(P)H-binding protein [Lactobacillus sp. ESL0681]